MRTQQELSLVTISCVATKEPTKGHPFWFHKALSDASPRLGVDYSTIGAMDQGCDHILGALSHSGRQRPASSVFAPWGMKDDVRRIKNLLRTKPSIVFHIYEGGFREFILTLLLLEEVPNAVALFNFNLTDPWQKAFMGKRISSRLARHLVRGHLSRLGARLTPFAETFETARDFSTALGVNFIPYPLFSSIQVRRLGENSMKTRKYDVAFFPGDEGEFNLVARALQQIADSGHRITSIVVPRWGYALSNSSKILAEKLGIEIRAEMLDATAYGKLYLDSKLAVFPYVGEYYMHTSSGRLLDAARAGCYSLAPKGSLTGNQALREGWGRSFELDELADSILGGLSGWVNFKIAVAPAPDATLEALLRARGPVPESLYSVRRTRVWNYFTFYSIFLGSGFRSWAPRVLQAFRNFREVGTQT